MLSLAFALAILLRAGRALFFAHVIEVDGTEYARLAESIREGRGYFGMLDGRELMFPPLYPSLTAAVSFVTGLGAEAAGRSVSVLLGSLLVLPVFFLARRLWSERAGIIAAFMTAVHPALVLAGSAVFVESTYLFCALSGLAVLARAFESRRARDAIPAGLSFGAAYLARHDGVYLALLSGLSLLFATLRPRGERLKALLPPLLFAATFLLAAAPHVAYIREVTGRLGCEAKSGRVLETAVRYGRGLDYATANYAIEPGGYEAPWLEPNEPDREPWTLRRVLAEERGPFLANLGRNLASEAYIILTGHLAASPVVLVLFAIGVVRIRRERRSGTLLHILLLLTAAYALFAAAAYKIVLRYLFLPAVILLLGAAPAIDAYTRRRRSAVIAVAIVVLSVSRSFLTGLAEFGESGADAIPRKVIGLRLLKATEGDAVRIAGTSSVPAYYAGATFVPLPVADAATAIGWLRRKRVTHVEVPLPGNPRGGRPGLADLIAEGVRTGAMKLLLREGDILVYEFEPR